VDNNLFVGANSLGTAVVSTDHVAQKAKTLNRIEHKQREGSIKARIGNSPSSKLDRRRDSF
jgi:hypothetical protein